MPTKYLYWGGLPIHYEHTGTTTLPGTPPPMDRGAAMLFLHGAGGNGRLFAPQLEHFGAQHSPVAIDLPGHGRSGGLAGPSSVAEAAELVAGVLDSLEAPPAVIVGHGLGGRIALLLARRQPSRVRAVVTIGTSAAPLGVDDEIGVLRDVVRGRRPQSFDAPVFRTAPDPAVMRTFWGEVVKTDPRVRLQDLEAQAASDLRPELGSIEPPVLVLHGAEDRYCPPSCGEELAAALPRGRFVAIPEAGHVAHLEQPARVNALVEECLA